MKYVWELTETYLNTRTFYTTREALLLDNAESLPPDMPGRYTLDDHSRNWHVLPDGRKVKGWDAPWQKTFSVNREEVTVRIERHIVYSTPQVRDKNAEEID